jgi:DNA-binding response OmpR family regulator
MVLSNTNRPWLSRFGSRDVGRVIVADPDETLFAMVRQLTAPDVWQVEHAETAEELRRMLRGGETRLAVVNLAMLDECAGLVEELSDRTRRGLRVVVTTDQHSERNERRSRGMGPAFYAPKPVSMDMLASVLEGALGTIT